MSKAGPPVNDISVLRFSSARAQEISSLTNLIGIKVHYNFQFMVILKYCIIFRESKKYKVDFPEATSSHEKESNEPQSKAYAKSLKEGPHFSGSL